VSSDTTAAFTPPRPLATDDGTAAFDCGRDALNHWFRRHAWRNQELGVSRTSVICDAQAGSIVGYVSLSTAQVERAWLPKAQQRNRPDPLPSILLGQLAVDLRWQGQGIARSLMFYALNTAVRLSDEIGCFCVLTHPLDDDVRALYAAFGFEDLPFDPARSMAVRIADLVRSSFFGAAD
jgi:predicted N-acetyltransferase YhbS